MPDIVIAGATFHDVPQIDIPKDGGGTASFTFESGTKSITENGEYDVSGFASAEVNVSGGTPTIEPLSVTANGTYTAPSGVDGYSPVTVNVSGGGGTTAEPNDVNFIDYDGTIRYSYTAADALALTELPANPSHTGLAAQGWNYTLSQLKAQVQSMGKCTAGQMYTTDDGKTRIYIYIDPDTPANRMTFYVRFTASTANNTTIDWGDGTSEVKGSTSATNYAHTYASPGNYTITLTVNSGTISFAGTSGISGYSIYGSKSNTYSHNRGRICKVEIGNNVTSIGGYTFQNCYNLTSITIPDSFSSVGAYAFQNCYNLTSITIPDSISIIGTYAFQNCYTLTSISIPDGILKIGDYVFQYCYNLTSVAIPDSITSIGASAFSNDFSLTSMVVPDGVTSIGASAFYNCYAVGEYHLLPNTPPTLANTNAFTGIASDCIIYVPYSEDHSVLEAYKTAANWSNYASKMQEESQ